MLFLLVVALAGILAPAISPHDALRTSLRDSNLPPAWMQVGSSTHPLGTDHMGRDVLSRLIHGARVSLLVAAGSILLAGIIGTTLGLAFGSSRLSLGPLGIRVVDLPAVLFGALPALPLIPILGTLAGLPSLLLVLAFGPGIPLLMLSIVVLPGIIIAHQVWTEALRIKQQVGVGPASEDSSDHSPFTAGRLFPRVVRSLALLGPLLMAYAVALEAQLSFLGAGVPPPTPAWGSMVADGRDRLAIAWWISAFPALAMLLTWFFLVIVAYHVRGWLRD